MSYILDALERSEHERNQAELPSFRQDSAMLFIKNRKRARWPLWVGVIALNITALAAIYIMLQPVAGSGPETGSHTTGFEVPTALSNGPDQRRENSGIAVAKNSGGASIANQATEKPSVEMPLKHSPFEPPVMGETFPDQAPSEQPQLALIRQRMSGQGVQSATATTPGVEPLQATPERTDQARSLDENRPKVSDNSRRDIESPPQAADLPLQIEQEVRISPKPESLSETFPEKEERIEIEKHSQFAHLEFLHEMDPAQRPNVPKLVFNSHIYSSDASARRVMINNIYLREGQHFSQMDLVYIGEEYIVLERQGRQFKLPVMRDWIN